MNRLSWDQYFMAQSHLLALRSTCTRLSVGATIVREKRMIAGGYNGSIAGGDHCIDSGCYVIEGHCVRTIHAEMNAILQCAKFGVPTRGAEIYVTHFPCLQCCKAIIQAGIQSVFYSADYKNHPYAVELFQQAGVKVKQVERKQHEIDQSGEKDELLTDLLTRLKELVDDESEMNEIKQRADRIMSGS
ncbi:ComE operon protein 2 [Bacillus sp. FJAT-42376]|uniref:ComE operon protein 2 n=1 Tax=Bacillus sp. FJAT-42376 TaxID=2014076 RepID=UPI000F511C84|nr:ComE operon protein 2 [Bacillus sp. FJAT-42376]AZB43692.1 ComE operon protein 2 [Bacillus sp. FJAT-42376]